MPRLQSFLDQCQRSAHHLFGLLKALLPQTNPGDLVHGKRDVKSIGRRPALNAIKRFLCHRLRFRKLILLSVDLHQV